MIELDLTKEINGEQLRQEIGADDVYVVADTIVILGNVEKAFAQSKLDAHTPKPTPQPTIAEKLASVGLSIDDLKEALGL